MPRYAIYDPYANRFIRYGEYKITKRSWLGGNRWRFFFKGLQQNLNGMECYVWHTFHFRPAILIEEAEQVTLQDVTIHSQPGMGIVGHRSRDLFISGLRVVPSPGTHLSTNTDATHFTSCKGTVRIENSVFEGQGDDSVNIHTYYHTITEANGCVCRTRLEAPDLTHTQTADHPDTGDLLELTDLRTLRCVDIFRVLAYRMHGLWECELQLDKPLPENCAGFAFANATQTARLVFNGNFCRNHIARSVLVKVKEALIENNTFVDVTGTAVYIAAESWWFEGLCTTERTVIRNNRILHCGRADGSGRRCSSGGICVTVDAESPDFPTHAHVEITDNLIDCPEAPHGVYVSNTRETVIARNQVVSRNEPLVLTP